MVAAGHPLAAQAAARILFEAETRSTPEWPPGSCSGWCIPDMVSFAGVAPILVHQASTGETFEVSGVGPYPRRATAEFFRTRCGGEIPVGLLRTVVPASPDAWCAALERWGTTAFAQAVAPALECAERGFPLSTFSAYQIRKNADTLRRLAHLGGPVSARRRAACGRGACSSRSELAETIRLMVAGEAKAPAAAAPAGSAPRATCSTAARSRGASPTTTPARAG